MCGIAGIVHPEKRTYREAVGKMLEAIRYRGPDGSGIHEYPHCSLGHVRLSIVDLANGSQPMLDPTKRLGVVFNGEIYGYRDIKRQLQSAGYAFRTDCDTEILLALYARDGQRMMSQLPGMFAFAIWDEDDQSLFCARDRFGEKPFYYAQGRNGEFIFASEIKAILATGLVDPVLDLSQVWHFLNYSYVYPTQTIYKNIQTLPPAHTLVWKDGRVTVAPYWKLPPTQRITEGEAVEEFRRLFRQAVERQLVADVPVGAFLSGGLDSGSVVAQAAELVPQVTTVSFAFREGVDESPVARTMAERYSTRHIEVRDIDFDIADMLGRMQEIFDEPMADPANIPAYLIAKAAREHVTVVVTGDAGDEILGGYEVRYRALDYFRQYRQEGISVGREKARLEAAYFLARAKRKLEVKARGALGLDSSRIYLQGRELQDLAIRLQALRMLGDDVTDIAAYIRKITRVAPDGWTDGLGLAPPSEDYFVRDGLLVPDDPDNAIRADLLDYLEGNGFVKTDRTTMAVSLESRTPFCDKDLAEFCISLPFALKEHAGQSKYILRKAMGDRWTEPVRKGIKHGFASPFDRWLRHKDVQELEQYYLRDRQRSIFGLLDYDAVQRTLGDRRRAWQEWCLLNLSMWMESHPCVSKHRKV